MNEDRLVEVFEKLEHIFTGFNTVGRPSGVVS